MWPRLISTAVVAVNGIVVGNFLKFEVGMNEDRRGGEGGGGRRRRETIEI
jgi:hypothetical protein